MTTLAVAILTATLPASASQQGFDELAGGEYRGWAVAAGPATVQQTDVSVVGRFILDIPFAVPLDGGPTSGTWDLNGTSFWTISFGNLGTAISNQNHSASGPVTGDRTTLTLGATSIVSTGLTRAPLIADLPVDNTDSIGPLELQFEGLLCDYAWGEWILSWKTELGDGGFADVGFLGDWGANRLPLPDDPSREDFEAILPQLISFQSDMMSAFATESRLDGVPILPFDRIWDLIEQAVALINQLNNLSACDEALLGPDRVARYINRLTGLLQVLVRVLLENVRLQDDLELTAEAALELTAMLAGVGGIGEGAVRTEIAEAVEGVVEERIDIVVNNTEQAIDDPIGFAGDRAAMVFDFVFGGGR